MNQVDLTVYEAKSGKPAKVSLVQNLIFYQDFYAVLLGKTGKRSHPAAKSNPNLRLKRKSTQAISHCLLLMMKRI